MFSLTSVRSVLDASHETLSFEQSFDVDDFSVEGLVYHVQGPAVIKANIAYAGEGILVTGVATLPVIVSCVRCLDDVELTLTADLDLLFYLQPTLDEEGDPLPSVDEEGRIALFDEVYAALRIEAPFAPLCSEECKGLCPTCGVNFNHEICACASRPNPSHPFAGLKDLLKEED